MMSNRAMGVLAAAALAVGGCDRQSNVVDASSGAPRMVESQTDLVAQGRPPVPDFPVPTGFELKEKESRSFAVAGMRNVEHVYTGWSDKYAVKRFYQRQMPTHRWVIMSDLVADGIVTLEFEKEGRGERCLVLIKPVDYLLFQKTRIVARVWTSARAEGSSTK
jgi:hypothetical protein